MPYGMKKAIFRVQPRLVDLFFAANAAIGDTAWLADIPCELVAVEEVHNVAGNDAGAVTLDVKKLTGTQLIDSAGSTMLASTFNLKSAANTPVRKTRSNGGLTTTLANRRLAIGDRLGFDIDGTLTALAGVHIVAVLIPLGPPTNW